MGKKKCLPLRHKWIKINDVNTAEGKAVVKRCSICGETKVVKDRGK